MPTLLTTRRMSPELAARIRRSVRGRDAAPRRSARSARQGHARFTTLVLMAGSACWLFFLHRRSNAELESARAEQIARFQREAALTKAQRNLPVRAKRLAREGAGPSTRATSSRRSSRAAAAFDATLARPTRCTRRGPVEGFHGDAAVTESAAGSLKDTFVYRLLDAPSNRAAKALPLARPHRGLERRQAPGNHRARRTTAKPRSWVWAPYLCAGLGVAPARSQNQLDLRQAQPAHLERAPLEESNTN